jgi:hypothetical protein
MRPSGCELIASLLKKYMSRNEPARHSISMIVDNFTHTVYSSRADPCHDDRKYKYDAIRGVHDRVMKYVRGLKI